MGTNWGPICWPTCGQQGAPGPRRRRVVSLEAMLWAWEQQVVDGSTDRFVLLALADHADPDEHRAYPSVGRIAARTGAERADGPVRVAAARRHRRGDGRRGRPAGHARLHAGRPVGGAPAAPPEGEGVQELHPGGAPAAPEQSVDGVKKTSNEDQEIRLARLRALRRGDAAAGEGSRPGDAAPDR